jgi:hypothetical protein
VNQAGDIPLVAQPRRWDVIASFMLEQGYKTFVEVGCKEGRTTGHVLKNVPDSCVIAIDPWCAMPDQRGVVGGETYEEWDFAAIEKQFWENVGTDHQDMRVNMKRHTSEHCARVMSEWKDVDGKPFRADLVFIDAAHDYENVKLDIQRWWPLVRDGGMLVGHDFNHKWPGVERAVADSFDLFSVGCAPDSIWFVIKAPHVAIKAAA